MLKQLHQTKPADKETALYLDIEGWNLSRHGTVSIVTILVHPSNQAQLIDVSALGDLAFSAALEDGKTLRSILEDRSFCKYIWDVRNDANALSDDKTYVRGLDKCIQNDLKLRFIKTSRWLRTKQDTKKLMCTDVFSIRPLEPKTIEYYQNDIIHLPALQESEHRATQARSPEYDPQSKGKKVGPWGSGGKGRILTINQMCEMIEEEREEAIERDLFGYNDDLEFLDGDDGWDQEGPGDYEDWGALHSDWDKY
ncbi:hypothetical protein KJE20_13706 [Pyrenophora tritici-repentis]|uniref:Uncharacterized protein n=1 Tax=Pyrenophora tritici-repentis TaxID=45151 RepID=A0A316ZTS6_9PLEO|nr:hypothetical protein Ptr86124_011209 [Pyrenophora tritici-repentis]KAI1676691.1 hypothetical protein KJE20_13706 [Pyrenophora tritici-repentis]